MRSSPPSYYAGDRTLPLARPSPQRHLDGIGSGRHEARDVAPERLEACPVEATSRHEPVDVGRVVRGISEVPEHVEMIGDRRMEDVAPYSGIK
jgi:hypothetical protein